MCRADDAHSDFLLQLSAKFSLYLVTYPEVSPSSPSQSPRGARGNGFLKALCFERVALWLSLLGGSCGLTHQLKSDRQPALPLAIPDTALTHSMGMVSSAVFPALGQVLVYTAKYCRGLGLQGKFISALSVKRFSGCQLAGPQADHRSLHQLSWNPSVCSQASSLMSDHTTPYWSPANLPSI